MARGAVMDDEEDANVYEIRSFESDQVELARRWIAELKGGNRDKAVELLRKVREFELTSEEALSLLTGEKT
jgi:hypothetical protein